MDSSIDSYLKELRAALRGADRATIQDALSDAEEHLTNALDQIMKDKPAARADEALAKIIEAYGAPAEVAAAYKEMEAMITPTLAPVENPRERSLARQFFGILGDIRAYAAILYLCFSLVTGIIYFTWVVTGLSVSISLIVLIIGFPLLTLILISFRGVALVEGRIVEAVLGVRMPRRPVFIRRDRGFWGGIAAVFTDRTTWTATLYMVLHMPLGIIYFTLFFTLIVTSLAFMLQPLLELVFDLPIASTYYIDYYTPYWAMPLMVIGGFLLLILTLHLAKFVGRLHGRYAKALLVMADDKGDLEQREDILQGEIDSGTDEY